MSRYSIEGSTLTAIGDAIREKTGGTTRIEYIPKEVWILKTDNVNSLEDVTNFVLKEQGRDGFRENVSEVITIPGAKKLILKIAMVADYNQYYYELPEYSGNVWYAADPLNHQIKEYEVEGDTITINVRNCVYTNTNAFYAEVRGYDENENQIKDEDTLVPIEVKNTLTPTQMAEEVQNMLLPPPDSAFTLTGNCSYRFGYNGWNWFIKGYGNKIITKDITNTANMFIKSSKLISIPFDINGKTDGSRMSLSYLFDSCHNLTNIPKITGKIDSTNNMFNHCRGLRELKEESITELDWSYIDTLTSNYSGNRSSMFQSCYSLRKYPNSFLAHGNPVIIYSYAIYCGLFNECFVLDEIVDLPIQHKAAKWTSNAFNSTFKNCARIKKLTFETNEDGSPIVVNGWSKQTIDLSSYIGYISTSSVASITGYNSGITKDKQVTDAASYQALKNDPDWFSTNIDYSRYNHDSAVETINTLPDLSGGAGGNIIKFKGAAGALTDGGAINTLTEEEIAVATVKGWTVSLV